MRCKPLIPATPSTSSRLRYPHPSGIQRITTRPPAAKELQKVGPASPKSLGKAALRFLPSPKVYSRFLVERQKIQNLESRIQSPRYPQRTRAPQLASPRPSVHFARPFLSFTHTKAIARPFTMSASGVNVRVFSALPRRRKNLSSSQCCFGSNHATHGRRPRSAATLGEAPQPSIALPLAPSDRNTVKTSRQRPQS